MPARHIHVDISKSPVTFLGSESLWVLSRILRQNHTNRMNFIGIGLKPSSSLPTPDPIFKCRTPVPGVLQASPASRNVALKVFKPCLWDNSNNSYDGRPLVYMDVEKDTLVVHYPKLTKAVLWCKYHNIHPLPPSVLQIHRNTIHLPMKPPAYSSRVQTLI